jgi:hypothetical protein
MYGGSVEPRIDLEAFENWISLVAERIEPGLSNPTACSPYQLIYGASPFDERRCIYVITRYNFETCSCISYRYYRNDYTRILLRVSNSKVEWIWNRALLFSSKRNILQKKRRRVRYKIFNADKKNSCKRHSLVIKISKYLQNITSLSYYTDPTAISFGL